MPLSLGSVAARMGLTAESDTWQRTVYAAETQLAAFAAGKIPEAAKRISMKMGSLPAMAQGLRLPIGSATPEEAARFWHALFTKLLRTTAPMLLLQPLGSPWIDVIVGCPGVKQLVCLRASPQVIPKVEDVPYNLPAEQKSKAAGLFREFCEQAI